MAKENDDLRSTSTTVDFWSVPTALDATQVYTPEFSGFMFKILKTFPVC